MTGYQCEDNMTVDSGPQRCDGAALGQSRHALWTQLSEHLLCLDIYCPQTQSDLDAILEDAAKHGVQVRGVLQSTGPWPGHPCLPAGPWHAQP